MICDSYVAPALPKIYDIPRFTAGAFYFGQMDLTQSPYQIIIEVWIELY